MFTSRMVKVLTTESICVNFPRTANNNHKGRTIPILKFSTQPEKKCFSQTIKGANCKNKFPIHVSLIQLALLNDFYCM